MRSILLILLTLLVPTIAHSQTTNSQQKSSGTVKADNTARDIIPVHPHACSIEQNVQFPAKIESRERSEIRVLWSAVIEKIHVNIGDMVRKGQLIASVDTSDYKRQIGIYDDYVALINGQLKVAENDIKTLSARRANLAILVNKGINPAADLDQADTQILEAKNGRLQVERSLIGIQRSLDDLHKMEKTASFYSEMDGLVTTLIADPRSMVGKLVAMGGALIARIEKPGQYVAKANLLDIQLAGLKEGMSADIILADKSHYDGRIRFISPMRYTASDDKDGNMQGMFNVPKTSQYQALIDFQRPGTMLPLGLTAIAKVNIVRTRVQTCLPWNAIDIRHGEPRIRTFREGAGWSYENVKIGRQGTYDVEILSPSLDESIVVESKLW